MLPTNSTHVFQPLDVAVFAPMKKHWRKVMADWKKQSRSSKPLPKEIFPILLTKLVNSMQNLPDLLKSGFQTCGLHPLDRRQILMKLPQVPKQGAEQVSNEVVKGLLEEHRKVPEEKGKRGENYRKYKAGSALGAVDFVVDICEDDDPFADLVEEEEDFEVKEMVDLEDNDVDLEDEDEDEDEEVVKKTLLYMRKDVGWDMDEMLQL